MFIKLLPTRPKSVIISSTSGVSVNRISVGKKGQRQVFWTIFFSLGFFIYGVSQNNLDQNSYTVIANHNAPVARGIASE